MSNPAESTESTESKPTIDLTHFHLWKVHLLIIFYLIMGIRYVMDCYWFRNIISRSIINVPWLFLKWKFMNSHSLELYHSYIYITRNPLTWRESRKSQLGRKESITRLWKGILLKIFLNFPEIEEARDGPKRATSSF